MNQVIQYISEKIKNVAWNYINPATEEKQDSIQALIQTLANQGDDWMYLLTRISEILKPLAIVTSGSGRLNIDVQNVLGTIATVTTVTTVSTVNNVANQTNMGWLSAFDMQYNLGHMAYATSIGNFQ